MNSKAYRDLASFESEADRRARSLGIFHLPLRSVLSSYFLVAEDAFRGGRLATALQKPDPDKGGTILSRISYLRPFYRSCTGEFGADLEDALSVLNANHVADLKSALLYGHFCEIMPFVHRGTYKVEAIENGFRLRFPSDELARHELLDIVASELALTALEKQPPYPVDALRRMVRDWPKLDGANVAAALWPAYEHHLQAIRERDYVRTASYKRVLGFEREEFVRIRAALMALASWCTGMSLAAEAMAFETTGPEQSRLYWESMEWSAPLLSSDFVLGTVQGIAGVGRQCIGAVLQYFMEAPLSDGPAVSGDGYLTPLISIGEAILFSPPALFSMTPERNILYALNKLDRERFDELVSAELEPSLLEHAKAMLEELPQVRVVTNVDWADGEIDLLAYNSATNTALQLQAKAAIPPQGARMTRQIEANTIKAVKQLEQVENLASVERDGILSNAFGEHVAGVAWSSGVLSRSSFGTAKAWQRLDGRGAFNLTLLKRAVDILVADMEINLMRLPEVAAEFLNEVANIAFEEWEEAKIEIFGKDISFPNLRLNNAVIGRYRADR